MAPSTASTAAVAHSSLQCGPSCCPVSVGHHLRLTPPHLQCHRFWGSQGRRICGHQCPADGGPCAGEVATQRSVRGVWLGRIEHWVASSWLRSLAQAQGQACSDPALKACIASLAAAVQLSRQTPVVQGSRARMQTACCQSIGGGGIRACASRETAGAGCLVSPLLSSL